MARFDDNFLTVLRNGIQAQVFDLVDRIVVFRRGRNVANLPKSEADGQDVVAYITGAKTGAGFEGQA